MHSLYIGVAFYIVSYGNLYGFWFLVSMYIGNPYGFCLTKKIIGSTL